ncbi:hypothetical protein HW115_08925 [Verrucomicrobiaceae bacterium N1E253]|uniref:DUF4175 domain-containing protein n=1 Tax=Oceaniferula marina TaxID=2748318 RepID=A0A851GIM8_9BACT|nr:DUF4175 family protein [Oceaniferula marina]NWK55731.1 hypothetical protein [Oceaniferula marina]
MPDSNTPMTVMSQAPTPEITDGLKAILKRIRRLQWTRGLLAILTISLSGLLAIMAADWFLAPLAESTRWAMFAIWLLGCAIGIWRFLWEPLRRRITLVQIARWLEVHHPDIQERISTSLELADRSSHGMSPALLDEIAREARVDIARIQPRQEIHTGPVKRWLAPTLLVIGLFALLFAIWPNQTGRLFVRAIAPFANVGNAAAIHIEISPGNLEVLEGEPIEIQIHYTGDPGETLVLETHNQSPGSTTTTETLPYSGTEAGKHLAVYRLSQAKEDFAYRVRVGKAESEEFHVKVWPKPQLRSSQVSYRYPAYTGWNNKQQELNNRGIAAIAGTQIEITAKTNTPVIRGDLQIKGSNPVPLDIHPGADQSSLSCRFPITKKRSGQGTILLKHRLGQEFEAARFPINVLPDKAPSIEILSPDKQELTVRPDEHLPITYQIREDIGLQSVELVSFTDPKHPHSTSWPMPTQVSPTKKQLWRGEHTLPIATLLELHPKAREINILIQAKDNRPPEFDGPGVGKSAILTLKISRSATSLARQELDQQQSSVRETARKAREAIRQAKEKMDANRDTVRKEEIPKHNRQQLAKAREQLHLAEKSLHQLAKEMENTVHAPKAEHAKKAADKSREAREKLETAPLQNTPDERKKELDQARDAAEDAMKQLDQLQQNVDRDRQRVEDIARLRELAQKESELARQAEQRAQKQQAEQAKQTADASSPEPNKQDAKQDTKRTNKQNREQAKADEQWQQQQRQVQEELRRAINERPDAQAEASRQQAEQSRELAEQSRKLASQQKQLQSLSQQAEKQQQSADRAKQAEKTKPQSAASKQAQKQASKQKEAFKQQVEKALQQAQQDVIDQAEKQLEHARQEAKPEADTLPDAIAKAKDALMSQKAEAKDKANPEKDGNPSTETAGKPSPEQKQSATEQSKQAAKAFNEIANQQSHEESKPSNNTTDPAANKPEEQADTNANKPSSAEHDAGLESLAERQESIAKAAEQLAQNKPKEALAELQGMQAKATEQLADDIQALPEVQHHSGERQQAEHQSRQAREHAREAARTSQEGQLPASTQRNEQASRSLEQTAKALDAEAKRLDQQAKQAESIAQREAAETSKAEMAIESGQQPGRQTRPMKQANVDAKQLAKAFEQAAEASQAAKAGQNQKAAEASRQAADALQELAAQAMENMQAGRQQPASNPATKPQTASLSEPSKHEEGPENKPSGQGTGEQNKKQNQQPSPGVPPELAKLGVSIKDWEKLQHMLKSDIKGTDAAHIPEDYRQLVQQYFQQIASEGKEDQP